jgi:hypothetical protein
MADFAVGATVMEGYFGWEAGSFFEVYVANRQQAGETLLANEAIADAIEELLGGERRSAWSGAATQVQEMLAFYGIDTLKCSKDWPGGPQALSRKLKRIAPALRAADIEYTEN